MGLRRLVPLVALVASTAVLLIGANASAQASASPKVTTVSLSMHSAYVPHAKVGTTDDYHCTLLDPRVKSDAFVVSSQFIPGSAEVHHAALFLVSPKLAAAARRADVGGRGWTCFGEASLPGVPFAKILKDPMLSEWAPGHGADQLPAGTGISLPKGSLVIMQVHYNLLVGHRPVRNRLVLHTVPASTALEPLRLNIALSPPDVPCAIGVAGPLCDRAASLANQGQRFDPLAVTIVDSIERACHRDIVVPPAGSTTTCSWPVGVNGYIVRTQAHMHLLGRSFSLTLNPSQRSERTVLRVSSYNFDDQKAYNLNHPIAVHPGDTLQVSCTYDASLAQKLPLLRSTPPHFVTWGDGSTDEMCVGLAYIAPALPGARART